MSSTTPKSNTPDAQINLHKWFSTWLSYWWVFLLFLAASVVSGQLYLRYTTFEYSASAKLMIKGAGNTGGLSEVGILAKGLGISGGTKDLSNEIQILTSRPILTKAIDKIGADVTYFRIGEIKDAELYDVSPILIDSFRLANEITSLSFFVRMGYYQEFDFLLEKDGHPSKQVFGKTFSNELGTFKIVQNKSVTLVPGLYRINILPSETVAEKYKRRLKVEVVGSQYSSSILELKLQDRSSQKAVDLINALMDTYNEAEIDDETQILSNTIDFIGQRIENLSQELSEIESEIERFKIENRIITEKASSSLDFALTELRTSLALKSNYEVENDLLISLEKHLKANSDQLIPAHIGTSNSALANMIQEYNQTFLQRKRLLETATLESPIIIKLTATLVDLKDLIITSIEESRKNIGIPATKTLDKIRELRKEITNIPSFEKELIEKLRMQGIKESLYLFLLEKKEETSLSRAISEANTRIIEAAKSSAYAVYPQKKLVLMGSIIMGSIIPSILVFLIGLFKTSIDSEETLKSLTSIPIIGRINSIKGDNKVIARSGNRSINQEAFRLLRSNLSFLNVDVDKPVILVTSSVSGEGKSIIAINLGLTIALSRKKTVLVDLDLRKPRVSEYLDVSNNKGVTNFMMGHASLDEITNQIENTENFSYVSSGPIPPNPAEMLESGSMDTLIKKLQNEFDCIILDSSPMGLVADSLSLRKFVTNTLYVVRHKYSKQMMIRQLEELHLDRQLTRPSIVINDVRKNGGQYGYGGYNSAYGSGYYIEEK